MQVYIEYVILDNLIMDYILIKQTAKLLKLKFNRLRIFCAAIIGVVGAALFPLFVIKAQYLFLLKILLGLLICFVAVKYTSVGEYIKFFNVFLLLTFTCGGAVIGVYYLIGIDLKEYGTNLYGVLPMGINFLVGYLLVIISKKIIQHTYNLFVTDKFRYNCIILKGNTAVKVKAYYDSGNLLFDNVTGLPVALVKKKIIDKLIKQGADLKVVGKMQFSTVTEKGTLSLYEIDCLLIEGKTPKRRNCLIAESSNLNFAEDLLLSAYIL